MMKNKFFEYWRIYATNKSSRKREIRKAAYFYNLRLKQKALNYFMRNAMETKRIRMFYKSLSTVSFQNSEFRDAEDFYKKIVLKRALRVWLDYAKNRRRRKCLHGKIIEIREKLIYEKYIEHWKSIFCERKENAELLKKAIASHRNFLLRKSLRLLIKNRNYKFLKKHKWEKAILHHDKKILNKSWNGWIKYCNAKIEKIERICEIREFYKSKLLQRTFSSLITNVSDSIAEREMQEKAMNFYSRKLLRRFFRIWIENQRRINENEKKIEIHRKKAEFLLMQNSLRKWRFFVWKKKCSRRTDKKIMNHYNKKLSIKAINIMKNYVLYKKRKAASLFYIENRKVEIFQILQEMYINRWRKATILCAQERQKFYRAEEHYSFRTIKHFFDIWKIFSERWKIRAKRKKTLNDIGISFFLKKYINNWRMKNSAIAAMNERENQASMIYSRKITSRLFHSWKKYANRKKNRRIEIDEMEKLRKQFSVCDFSVETPKNCIRRGKKAKETPSFKDKDKIAYGISSRFVLPEYMMKTIKRKNHFSEGNERMHNSEFNEFAKRYLSFENCKDQSEEYSDSNSET